MAAEKTEVSRPIFHVSKEAVLLVAVLSSFVTPLMAASINIAIPSIGKEFGLDAILLGWLATSYSLAAATFLVPFGRVADIYGRRKLLLWGVVVYTVASLMCAVSTSEAMLLAFRVLQGIGAAMQFGTSMAILTSVYPQQERGRVLGINVASVYVGLSVGPFAGGMMTQYLGWRSIFLLMVPLGLAMVAAILWGLRGEWAEARGEKLDLPGSVMYGASIVVLMYGLTQLPGALGGILIFMGMVGLLAFVRWEMRVKNPVLNVALFARNSVFALSNLAAFVNYTATAAVGFLLSLYLQYLKGLSPEQTGLVLLAQPVVQAIFSPFAGRLSDRVEPRIVASAGMVLTVIGLVLFTFLDAQTSQTYIVGVLLVSGLGFALFSSPNTNAVMSSVEKRYYGVASATVGTMRLTGQMLSLGITMLVFAVTMGAVQITPQYYPVFLGAMRAVFIICTALCVVGVFASLARGKVR